MSKRRRLFVGGLASAGLSLVLAPRVAGSRRAALARLRARGAASGAFAGTECSVPEHSSTAGAAPERATAGHAAEGPAAAEALRDHEEEA